MRVAVMGTDGTEGYFGGLLAHATANPTENGPVDLILFTTKTWQIEEAARQIQPIVGPSTALLPIQNGVDASERSNVSHNELLVRPPSKKSA
jgi:2-dehydropantoate 2-reductase